jgi:hypothetical protein
VFIWGKKQNRKRKKERNHYHSLPSPRVRHPGQIPPHCIYLEVGKKGKKGKEKREKSLSPPVGTCATKILFEREPCRVHPREGSGGKKQKRIKNKEKDRNPTAQIILRLAVFSLV